MVWCIDCVYLMLIICILYVDYILEWLWCDCNVIWCDYDVAHSHLIHFILFVYSWLFIYYSWFIHVYSCSIYFDIISIFSNIFRIFFDIFSMCSGITTVSQCFTWFSHGHQISFKYHHIIFYIIWSHVAWYYLDICLIFAWLFHNLWIIYGITMALHGLKDSQRSTHPSNQSFVQSFGWSVPWCRRVLW